MSLDSFNQPFSFFHNNRVNVTGMIYNLVELNWYFP